MVAAGWTTNAAAQEARPRIYVNYTSQDAVGRRLAYELRTEIARSPLLSLTDVEDDAFIRANLITIAADDNDGYSLTAYSFVITIKDLDGGFDKFYTHFAGICGANRVQLCARDMVTSIVETRDDIIAALQQR